MAVNLSPIWGAGAQLFDNSGNVLSGGKIYTYAAGTTTPAVTYTDSSGITANSNPIILNSAGRVAAGQIWIDTATSYKFIIKTDSDVLIATYDNLSGLITGIMGNGPNQYIYTSTTGDFININDLIGSGETPNPAIKVSKTNTTLSSEITGDGGEQMSAILGISAGTSTNEAQPVGVYGGAISNYSGSSSGAGDACAVYGASKFTGTGTGTAIGAFFTGRAETSNGRATALELATQNASGLARTWNQSGYSQATGIWTVALGDEDSAVGFNFGNPFGYQFEVGIGFTAQVTGGKTGAVSGTTFYDAGNATTSLYIQGTHTTALGIGATAGNVVIGSSGPASAGVKLAVFSTSDTQSPVIFRAHSATQSANLFRVEDYLGSPFFAVDAGGRVGIGTNGASSGVQLAVQTYSDAASAGIFKAHSVTQAADIFRVESSAGTALFSVDAAGHVLMTNLPTSPVGLAAGSLWKDTASGNVIKIV